MKYFLLWFACFLVILGSGNLYCQSNILPGEYSAGIATDGWTLHQGSGMRVYSLFVLFEKPFDTVPTVSITITGIDASKDFNLRYRVKVERITTAGMLIKISTWEDTKLYLIEGQWRAIERR